MNKANWQTGIAGFLGVAGLGAGFWWADAAAAAIISISIISDGWKALRIAAFELVDGVPYELGDTRLSNDAKAVAKKLSSMFPDAKVKMRETGRYIRAEVTLVRETESAFGASKENIGTVQKNEGPTEVDPSRWA